MVRNYCNMRLRLTSSIPLIQSISKVTCKQNKIRQSIAITIEIRLCWKVFWEV